MFISLNQFIHIQSSNTVPLMRFLCLSISVSSQLSLFYFSQRYLSVFILVITIQSQYIYLYLSTYHTLCCLVNYLLIQFFLPEYLYYIFSIHLSLYNKYIILNNIIVRFNHIIFLFITIVNRIQLPSYFSLLRNLLTLQ